MRQWLLLAAIFSLAFVGCDDGGTTAPPPDEGGDLSEGLIPEGQDGKPTFGATGEPELKADALQGARGISTAYDTSATQVWAITGDWEDTTTPAAKKAGMAWPADSGLTWNEKYSRWVDSMEKITSAAGYYETYQITTPYGRTLPGPSLECAESSIFLRALFASWYGLPFILEGRTSGGARLYLGHMGFRTNTLKFSGTPDFKTAYRDFSSQADSVRAGGAWPKDERLRTRKLAGGFDDEQPALGIEGAHFGTYMDELVLNKRVGYFMMYALAYFGSVNVADTRNTYNRKAESIRPGDSLVHRYGPTGIGHVLVVKEVTVDAGQYVVELMSGSMPRRQPDWEDANSSRYSLVYDAAGSSEDSGNGGPYAKFGGGLKGWRIPKKIGGQWTMTIAAKEQADWVDSSDLAAIGARVEKFREILTTLTPEQKRAVIVQRIQDQRDHISRYPASCSARHRREEAFAELYAHEAEQGREQAEVDAEFRTLADYVFGELVYEQSKTCCWNSTNGAMYEIVMQKALAEIADHSEDMCVKPSVFKAVGNGGYDPWKQYAESIGRGAEWKAWSEDEGCPQRGVQADTEAELIATDWCTTGGDILGGGDTYRIELGAWSTLGEANEVVEFVNDWFADHLSDSAVAEHFSEAPGIDVFADATLFKVRLGSFPDSDAADAALQIVRDIREDFTAAGVVAE